jgi:predicted acetyltransferase
MFSRLVGDPPPQGAARAGAVQPATQETYPLPEPGRVPQTLQYRFARNDEIEAAGRLVAHSFPGAERSPEWWAEQLRDPPHGGGAETLWLGFDGERMVAACQVHPLRQWIAGERLAMAGIGTVAIAPTHRRRSLGAELVASALRAARSRGDVCSALYPFRVGFYRKLGYGNAGEALQYRVPPACLPDSPERLRIELLEGERGRAAALELYRRWAPAETGQLDRDARAFERVCAGRDRALFGYRGEGGELQGYALVVYRADLPSAERTLEVEELAWTTREARRGLYGWLASMGDQWRYVLVRSLPSHRLVDWLTEPRLPGGAAAPWGLWAGAATLMMGPMFRLLDVEAAWSRRRVVPGSGLSLALELDDPQVPENGGRWRLELADGAVRVERGDAAADLTLRLDVPTLSSVYIGALTASAALGAGQLHCDRPDLLPRVDAALRLPEPWLFDRF